MARQLWAVSVDIEDQDPETYGPYTKTQADRVVARLDAEVALATSPTGVSYHPRGVIGAAAVPLIRYDMFLTGDERRRARRDARKDER